MRTFLVSLLLAVFLISTASAELLTTANPIGQGKWAFELLGLQNQNASNNSAYSQTAYGGYAGYGLTDKLDLLVNVASANMSGLPTGMEISGTAIGANLKYAVIEEAPVSVAVGLGYKSTNTTIKTITTTNTPGTQMMLGIGVSKIMAPFIPYGGVAYRKTASNGTDASTQLDGTIGSAIAWSKQGAIFIEYTLQSITLTGGTNYSSGQIALGVGYKI
ncbi:MAG: hypothetical protein U9R38_05650 [Candidatus Margulisiibacteriota bacterium]|nr:hypothetical protein [Candidatus Margulisiibacteriota bacterium]